MTDFIYLTGTGEYLEPSLFILDPWGFIAYNFLINNGFRRIFKILIINNRCSIIYGVDYHRPGFNSLSAKSILAGEKLVAMYLIST